MSSKYRRQVENLDLDIKHGLKRGYAKHTLLSKLRRKKIIEKNIIECQKKIDVLVHKQYALEQLNINILQIEALKDTSIVFKSYTKTNTIEKIEKLTDTINDLQDDIMDINEALNTPNIDFDEDELEKELSQMETSSPDIIATFPVAPQDRITVPDEILEKQSLIHST